AEKFIAIAADQSARRGKRPAPVLAASLDDKPRRPRAKVLLAVAAAAAASAGAVAWYLGRGTRSTADAFLEAQVANLASRIQGQVARVLVKDNQVVDAGDVLVELDDRDARVRVDTAAADLASAEANLAAAETQLALTEKTVVAALRQARGGLVQ